MFAKLFKYKLNTLLLIYTKLISPNPTPPGVNGTALNNADIEFAKKILFKLISNEKMVDEIKYTIM